MNIPNGTFSRSDHFHASSDASLFSSSLPVLPHQNLNSHESYHQSVDETASGLNQFNGGIDNMLKVGDSHPIGSMLPDDEEELFSGLMDDLNLSSLPATLDDLEDYDLFGSGGGLELETDPHDCLSNKVFPRLGLADSNVDNGMPQNIFQNGTGSIAGEHPYGEHPSRTLFVRNINSNIEDSELKALFEQYGDIRTLYTACKHRGFVMISYYDIRASRAAMRALQSKLLKRRKLDIHFSIPKDNPSEKDVNQGTLVVFNLAPSVTNRDLENIFGAYGEIKEIRETPNKRHHKFVEFFDVRSADAALKALNRTEIAGKRIKLEHSRPGGARRNMMLQINPELEQDDSNSYLNHVESPLGSSPIGNYWCNSPTDHPLQTYSKSPIFGNLSPTTNIRYPEFSSILHSQGANPIKAASVSNDQGRRFSHLDHLFSSSSYNNASHTASTFQQPQSFGSVSSFGSLNSHPSHVETLSGSEFLWGSPSSSAWPVNPYSSNGKNHRFPYSAQKGALHQLPHVGSAPSGFFPRSPETSSIGSVAFRGVSGNMNAQRNLRETSSPSFKMLSSPRRSQLFTGNGSYPWPVAKIASIDDPLEDGRNQQHDSNVNQVDSKIQFQLDLSKIMRGDDLRTTLMIKNIPNKYTRNMLVVAIDEKNSGTYDFLYLPIDFKNKCNVGYAFINMVSPKFIIALYEAFNGKKWDKFNSEKVASLAYARIQGKAALIAHFQNSSLMNEDRRCQPIVFDGSESRYPIILENSQLEASNSTVSHPLVGESTHQS
ncbi:PREDICTED: protein MEI2-like 3 [Camelina sativa]|uniref:Protein MEI2-like 3 n=1 Tax=Camelina sativa TaxID=90675 RepID=A0ABM0UEB1_CAMSA|nr:PREDICTED: protein MEI2-like 3 [Camelina sativa]XP_010439901.1 PREDICTED: protein MEI2-like 3 [Camelina sativa]XP_010439902.1 PREDICTED: protein MEI2-like 3 [Camelina sativa]